MDFQKPPKPDWLGNRIGYSDKVPWPFTPVEAAPGQVSIWGRTYTWASHNAFPAQIVTQGNTLLARPIELELVSRGIRLPWKTKEWKLASSAPRTAVYEAVMEGGPFALTLQITVDFDGFMRFKGELKGAGVPLDSLKLIVPVRKEWVSYFHAAQFETIPELVNANYKAGSLAAFKKEFPAGATPFAGIFWLGGPRGGIQWIAEWDRGWRNPDRKNVMRLVEGKDDVALEVSIIGERTTLTEPLPVDFAFNVSPVREWSYYWTISTANGGSDALYPQNYDPQRLRSDLQKAKDAGITHVIHGGFGWPFHADVWVRGHNRPHFKENVATVHEMGLEYIFYGCWGYSSNGEESADFGADMMKVPLQPAGTDTYWYNPEGPWVDFFMAGLDTAIQEYGVDGIYLDSMANTMLCADPLAGQTFTDEQGRVHGKWTTFALRDWALRLQNVMHIDPLKKGLVYQHDSGAPNLAIVSLADIRCGGEDAPSTYSLRESWPLDSYLARFDMHTFGIPQETLWYNWWKRPLKENQVMAVPLLHGQMKNRDPGTYLSAINPDYELNTKPQIRILRVYQDFDIPHAEWWPYYREDNWISLNPGSLCASSYLHRGKKALVVVANLDAEAVTAKVTLDLAKAGFDGSSVIVTDALLGGTIPVTGDTFDLEIQPERYRLLLIEAPLADSPTTP